MSEQYPLLCEDVSDEDRFSSRFHHRRPLSLRGRAKYHVKGASAIMTRWPEHWTSILNYWWVGVGMIALTTFIIYNTLFSIAMLQPTDARPSKYASLKTIAHKTKQSSPEVFMHLFVNDNEEEDLNKYLPYIEVFANKYKDFTYNLILVANDTIKEETSNLSDETNNKIALNSLWTNDVNYGNLVPRNSLINVKHVTLSKYLEGSPINKYWKSLPQQFIRFLVRSVSVWNKGGIAINPIILTPQSPHTAYLEKFVKIIKNFKNVKPKKVPEQEKEVLIRKKYISPKVNNIRDIINALENESSDDHDKEILHTAESSNSFNVTNKDNIKMFAAGKDHVSEKQTNPHEKHLNSDIVTTSQELTQKEISSQEDNSKNDPKLLALFLDYLFNNKKTKSSNKTTNSMNKRSTSNLKEFAKDMDNKDLQMRNFWNDIKSSDNYKPMIVSAKGIENDTKIINTKPTYQDDDKIFELTVDLKGNLIATETPCHAFLGNVFINAIYHNEAESLTDFIIKELSIFCKGLLTSCKGIDVILV